MKTKPIGVALATGIALAAFIGWTGWANSASAGEPTCAGLGGIEVHGQHIIGDYVTGLGGNTLYRNDGRGTFTDVTAAAQATVPGWSSSAAFVDYDHDGHLDLYVGRYLAWTWESNPVCRPADGAGRAYCHPREFDPVASVLLHNNGDGTFGDASAASGIGAHRGKALGVAIHDYDRDGLIDLFVANDSMQQFLFRNTGRGTFAEVALTAGDLMTRLGDAVLELTARRRVKRDQ